VQSAFVRCEKTHSVCVVCQQGTEALLSLVFIFPRCPAAPLFVQAAGYGKVVSHVIIGLKTVKGTKQLKLDPTIYDSLQKERVQVRNAKLLAQAPPNQAHQKFNKQHAQCGPHTQRRRCCSLCSCKPGPCT